MIQRKKQNRFLVFHTMQGLTLIEVLLTVSILTLVAFLSIPFYARFLSQNDVQQANQELVISLRKAQLYSMIGKQNGSWGVKYTTSPKRFTLYLLGNPAFDEKFNLPSSIVISGFTDIQFAKVSGLPSSQTTITLSSSTTSKTITINSQGIVAKIN